MFQLIKDNDMNGKACMLGSERVKVKREKTAIMRFRHSKPIALALSQGIIARETSVFDYGCGRGEDIRYLRSVGIEAEGWDPHFRPKGAITEADVVNLGYVLNVIEDPAERQGILRQAYQLCRRVLVVAVRVDHSLGTGTEFSDGVLTSWGSFQKLYKQSEFREYLQSELEKRPHMAALGIAYIFKDEGLEASYLASLAIKRFEASRTSAIEEFSKDQIAKDYVQLSSVLGRPPVASEFENYSELLERFGSPARIERLAQQLLSPEAIREARQRRKEDILTYAAMMRLQGVKPLPFRLLPRELQADVKTLWLSYTAALREAEKFLFQIGDSECVRRSCHSSPIGKKLPDALYIHRSAEERMGALLRILVFAARQIVGDVDYNVLKISTDGKALSFLRYERFDEEPHPVLHYSVRVFFPRTEYSIRDYSNSSNPPILHRKETLIDPLHPSYKKFLELSEHEDRLGLLSRMDIGTKEGWLALLAEKGFAIRDHCIHATSETT